MTSRFISYWKILTNVLHFRKNTIFANLAWSLFSMGGIKLFRFFSVILTARILGMESWGHITTALIIVGFIGFIVDQGVSAVPSYHRVGDLRADRSLFQNVFLFRLSTSILAIGFIHLVDHFWQFSHPYLVFYSWVLLPRALSAEWFFQRKEKFHFGQIILFVKNVFFLLGVLIWLPEYPTPKTILLFDIGTEVIAGVTSIILAWLLLPEKNTKDDHIPAFHLFRLGYPFLLMGVLTSLHQNLDTVMISWFKNSSDAGEYDMGYRFGIFAYMLGATIILIVRPKLSRFFANNDRQSAATILEAVGNVLSPMALGIFIVGLHFPQALFVKLFPSNPEITRWVFQWMPIWIALSFINSMTADTLNCMNLKRAYLWGAFLCASTNIAGNLMLIPFFSGFGAIFSTILAEAVFLGFALFRIEVLFRKIAIRAAIPLFAALAFVFVLEKAFHYFGSHSTVLNAFSIVASIFVWVLFVFSPYGPNSKTLATLLKM